MGNKKNYKLSQSNLLEFKGREGNASSDNLVFETNRGCIDFNRWNYIDRPVQSKIKAAVFADRETFVRDLYDAVVQLSYELSESSIQNLASAGCINLFEFLDAKYKQGVEINRIEQFDSRLIENIISWLKYRPAKRGDGTLSAGGARHHYFSIKSVLFYFVRTGRISKDIFPYAPFVNVNRSLEVTEIYSKSEFEKIMRFLWGEIALIRKGEYQGKDSHKLIVYALVIAAKTGRNTSSILSMQTDCVQSHPLSPDTHVLLTTYKNRGMNTSVQAMRSSVVLENMCSAHKDVGQLITEVLEITSSLRNESNLNDLFIYEHKGRIEKIPEMRFFRIVNAIYQQANIVDDQGLQLRFQIKRMRKTFGNRVWQLSAGDPIKTARLMGNTTPVLNQHYLEVTHEMERNHKYLGNILAHTLSGRSVSEEYKRNLAEKLGIEPTKIDKILIGKFNTGVGRCSDPYNGYYAAKTDKPCSRFLACFRCPNQVVLEDDLYRLLSFYRLLLGEKGRIGAKLWEKNYHWVIKVIENEIMPKFQAEVVESAMAMAIRSPHTLWATRESLVAL